MNEIVIPIPTGSLHYLFATAEHVTCRTIGPHGQMIAEESFWDGKPSGIQKSWDENGMLMQTVALAFDPRRSRRNRAANSQRLARLTQQADEMACHAPRLPAFENVPTRFQPDNISS